MDCDERLCTYLGIPPTPIVLVAIRWLRRINSAFTLRQFIHAIRSEVVLSGIAAREDVDTPVIALMQRLLLAEMTSPLDKNHWTVSLPNRSEIEELLRTGPLKPNPALENLISSDFYDSAEFFEKWTGLQVLEEEPSEGALEIVLEVPEGVSDEEALRYINEAVTRADLTHRSHGGHGLKVRTIEVLSDATTLIPA